VRVPPTTEDLWAAYEATLVELGALDPEIRVMAPEPSERSGEDRFRGRYPERFIPAPSAAPEAIATAAREAKKGRGVFLRTSAGLAVGSAYGEIRESLCQARANVRIFADDGGSTAEGEAPSPPFLEDLGMMRGLPGMTVIVPADAPSTRGVTRALHGHPGPAYVRLARARQPVVTDGTFQIGRAGELRAGSDLAVVALGTMVGRALDLAEDLTQVGVSTRVLDFASVKPFDEPALLRAARDTGAILVLEEHSVLTGVGALVAVTTAENYPVPVRRVGIPDLFVESGDDREKLERYGFGPERIRDEAWELLRLRGKVS
jgi:transketolase